MKVIYSHSNKASLSKATFQSIPSMNVLHNHNYYELYYLLDGQRSYFIDNAIYELNVGDIVIVPPNTLHRTIGDKTKIHSRILISIPEEILEKEIVGEYSTLSKKYIFPITAKRRPFVEELFNRIEYETKSNDTYGPYLTKKYINEIFIFLLRAGRKNEIIYIDNETDSVIGTAARYIQRNFNRQVSLREVADMLGMDRTYFCKLFRNKAGFSFSQYIKEVRIIEAARLLTETEMSITEVAMSVGYNDSSYFAKVFKSIKGTTPLAFRKIRN